MVTNNISKLKRVGGLAAKDWAQRTQYQCKITISVLSNLSTIIIDFENPLRTIIFKTPKQLG